MSSTSAFGIVGGYIIIVLVLLITMILITQRSFFDFIFKIWDSIVSLVKGGHERYMEGQTERDLKKRDPGSGTQTEEGKPSGRKNTQAGGNVRGRKTGCPGSGTGKQ